MLSTSTVGKLSTSILGVSSASPLGMPSVLVANVSFDLTFDLTSTLMKFAMRRRVMPNLLHSCFLNTVLLLSA